MTTSPTSGAPGEAREPGAMLHGRTPDAKIKRALEARKLGAALREGKPKSFRQSMH